MFILLNTILIPEKTFYTSACNPNVSRAHKLENSQDESHPHKEL